MSLCKECADGYKLINDGEECESLCERDNAGNCKSCKNKD